MMTKGKVETSCFEVSFTEALAAKKQEKLIEIMSVGQHY